MFKRQEILQHVANEILKRPTNHVTRVAIDGVDGAGKTVFADELAQQMANCGRPIIRASVDDFHNPREVRYRLGSTSPEGFFRDSYDYVQLQARLLQPLGPDGTRRFRSKAFDHRANQVINPPEEFATTDAILLFDGIFLHRSELRDAWNFSVFLRIDIEVSIPRGARRGEGSPDPLAPSNQRYVEGQKLYLAECAPERRANLVIDNNDLENPLIVNRPG